jgi:hypothetical protein
VYHFTDLLIETAKAHRYFCTKIKQMVFNFQKASTIASLFALIALASCSSEDPIQKEPVIIEQTGEIRAGAFDEVALNVTGFDEDEHQVRINNRLIKATSGYYGKGIIFEIPYKVGSGIIEITDGSTTVTGPQFIYEEKYVGFTDLLGTSASITGTNSNSLVTYDPFEKSFREMKFNRVISGDFPAVVLTTTKSTTTLPNSSLYAWKSGQTLGMCANANNDIYFAQFYRKEATQMSALHTPILFNTTLSDPCGSVYEDVAAPYDEIIDMEVNANEELFTIEKGKAYIRKNTLSAVTTFAGSATAGHKDDTGVAAQFTSINSITIDNAGNLYVADGNCVRKVTPQGIVTTIAGSVEEGSKDGEAAQARFKKIVGIYWKNDGTLYIADNGNNIIKTLKDGIVKSLRNTTVDMNVASANVPLYVDSNNIIYTMLGGTYNPHKAFVPENLTTEKILQQSKTNSGFFFAIDLEL